MAPNIRIAAFKTAPATLHGHHCEGHRCFPTAGSIMATHADHSEKALVVAERYRTRMCRNVEMGVECPYQSHCMFAHSEAELRTLEANLADGLTTEEAIHAFQRASKRHARRERRNARRRAAACEAHDSLEDTALMCHEAVASDCGRTSNGTTPSSSLQSPLSCPSSCFDVARFIVVTTVPCDETHPATTHKWRHEPYYHAPVHQCAH